MKSQKIGAFLLQIVFFLTDFAEFRVKLVFCIQAEIIISSISERYPTVEKTIKNHHGNHTFSRKTHNSWDFLPSNIAWNPTFFVRFLKIEIQIKQRKYHKESLQQNIESSFFLMENVCFLNIAIREFSFWFFLKKCKLSCSLRFCEF